MMFSLDFHTVRGRAARVLLVALLVAPRAFAGDRDGPDTFIDEGPEDGTTSTTADFVVRSTAVRAEFWCLLDDEEDYRPCSRTPRYEGLAPGEHSFFVYSYDPDTGKVDREPAEWFWVVVEEGPPLDAGSTGGDGGSDAGAPGEDGGTPDLDAGTADGGTSGGEDAGGGTDAGQDAGAPGGTDAGSPGGNDAGSPGDTDAGSPGGTDAGAPGGQDAGSPGGDDAGAPGGEDAGGGDTDGGSTDGGLPDGGSPGDVPPGDGVPPEALDYLGGGVGCTGAPAPGAVAGLLLLVLALRRRRR